MVTTGMLWFDNSKTDLSAKIQKAASYYENKYGIKPTVCLIHPSMGCTEQIGDISVRTYRPVSPGHIWLGIDEE